MIALCTVALIQTAILLTRLPTRFREWDFDLFYASAFALRNHLDPYTTDFRPVAATLGINLSADYKTAFTPSFLLVFRTAQRAADA